MNNYFINQYANVYFDQELDTLFLIYLDKVPNDAMFLTINEAVLKAFLELNTCKFVADVRKMGIIGVKSQQWVVEVLLPTMIKHLNGKTLIHAQMLDPKEVLSKIAAANIKNKADKEGQVNNGFSVKQFSVQEELVAYLKSVS